MLYTTHTKRGLGVQVWGSYDDLRTLYDIISKFWNVPEFEHISGFENRNELISSFSYEVRKGMAGSRVSYKDPRLPENGNQLYGFEVSWVHIIFSLAALKENWNLIPPNKLDLSVFYSLGYWIEDALEAYGSATVDKIKPYLNGAIYGANPCLYQFMRQINMDFFLLEGGKQAFRKLPSLLRASTYGTTEYNKVNNDFEKDAKRSGCRPHEIDFDEESDIYEIVW